MPGQKERDPIAVHGGGGPISDLLTLHATCVAHGGRAVLLCGHPGSGKSALALQMMAFGARLVADDQVILWRNDSRLMARAPDALAGLIEARGVGILYADPVAEAEIVLVADLDQIETGRLPERRSVTLCDVTLDLVFAPPQGHLAAVLLHYLRFGRAA